MRELIERGREAVRERADRALPLLGNNASVPFRGVTGRLERIWTDGEATYGAWCHPGGRRFRVLLGPATSLARILRTYRPLPAPFRLPRLAASYSLRRYDGPAARPYARPLTAEAIEVFDEIGWDGMLHELWAGGRSTHGLWIPRGEVAEYAWILGDPDDLAAIRGALPGLPCPFNLADYRRVGWPKERQTHRTG